MALISGLNAGPALAEALGLSGQPIKRLVIVADVSSALTVFVERLVHEDELDAVRDTLASFQTTQVHEVGGVEVDEQGRAFVPAAEHARLIAAVRQVLATPTVHSPGAHPLVQLQEAAAAMRTVCMLLRQAIGED